jgi:hypothetical protein
LAERLRERDFRLNRTWVSVNIKKRSGDLYKGCDALPLVGRQL